MDVQQAACFAIEQIRQYELAAPEQIDFGSHILEKSLARVLEAYRGQDAVLVTGRRSARSSGLTDRLNAVFSAAGVRVAVFSGVYREPTVEIIREGVSFVGMSKARLVLAAGGGSVIDTAKALSALAVNEGDVEDYLEGVGRGLKLEKAPLPLIAIPTTAGTGAEMTKNAVIASLEKKYKKSMRDTRMIPRVAIIDPALTSGVSSEATAAGGLDAITQLVEVCISRRARPETTALALEALTRTLPALTRAVEHPSQRHAREQLAYASFVSGVCLANSGLGMAHGIAAGLGALFDVPHGVACGILLPHTLDYLKKSCEDALRPPLSRLQGMLFADPEGVEAGIALLHRTNRELGIPRDLSHLYLREEDVRALAQASMGSSMSACPVDLAAEQVYHFLRKLA